MNSTNRLLSPNLTTYLVPDGTTDIVVEIPEWNKNYARELDH